MTPFDPAVSRRSAYLLIGRPGALDRGSRGLCSLRPAGAGWKSGGHRYQGRKPSPGFEATKALTCYLSGCSGCVLFCFAAGSCLRPGVEDCNLGSEKRRLLVKKHIIERRFINPNGLLIFQPSAKNNDYFTLFDGC